MNAYQYPSLMSNSFSKLLSPEKSGREAGLLSKQRDLDLKRRNEAEILAKYGASSKEYGDFLASQKATYDPRRGF